MRLRLLPPRVVLIHPDLPSNKYEYGWTLTAGRHGLLEYHAQPSCSTAQVLAVGREVEAVKPGDFIVFRNWSFEDYLCADGTRLYAINERMIDAVIEGYKEAVA